jgi:hypothetical protein
MENKNKYIIKIDDKEFPADIKRTYIEKDMIVMGDIYQVSEFRSKPVMVKFKNKKFVDEYDCEYCVGYLCHFLYYEITPRVQNPVRKEEDKFCTVIGDCQLSDLEDVYMI